MPSRALAVLSAATSNLAARAERGAHHARTCRRLCGYLPGLSAGDVQGSRRTVLRRARLSRFGSRRSMAAEGQWRPKLWHDPSGRFGSILAAGSRPRERPESGTQAPSDKQQAGGGPFTRQRLREPTPRTGLGAARAGTRVRFWPLVDPARRGLFASSVTADMIRRQVAAPSSSPASASSLARAALSSSALSP